MPDLVLPFATFLPHSAGPYMALILIGFAIGVFGHLSSARWLVAAGVILIFLGAFLFPVAVNVTQDNPGPIQPPQAPEEGLHAVEVAP